MKDKCELCGQENPKEHQAFCKDLNCSGRMVREKIHTYLHGHVIELSNRIDERCKREGRDTFTWKMLEEMMEEEKAKIYELNAA